MTNIKNLTATVKSALSSDSTSIESFIALYELVIAEYANCARTNSEEKGDTERVLPNDVDSLSKLSSALITRLHTYKPEQLKVANDRLNNQLKVVYQESDDKQVGVPDSNLESKIR